MKRRIGMAYPIINKGQTYDTYETMAYRLGYDPKKWLPGDTPCNKQIVIMLNQLEEDDTWYYLVERDGKQFVVGDRALGLRPVEGYII